MGGRKVKGREQPHTQIIHRCSRPCTRSKLEQQCACVCGGRWRLCPLSSLCVLLLNLPRHTERALLLPSRTSRTCAVRPGAGCHHTWIDVSPGLFHRGAPGAAGAAIRKLDTIKPDTERRRAEGARAGDPRMGHSWESRRTTRTPPKHTNSHAHARSFVARGARLLHTPVGHTSCTPLASRRCGTGRTRRRSIEEIVGAVFRSTLPRVTHSWIASPCPLCPTWRSP
jgi:hypothetical protein